MRVSLLGGDRSAKEETTSPSSTTRPPVLADDIPVAHTPPGGYGDVMPEPILGACTEALVAGAPDFRGLWRAVSVEVDGAEVTDHRVLGHTQRIEQCGDRLVVTAAGVIHDMRCDGTEQNGVHDVAEFDFATSITVVATYENGVHVLRPVGLPGVEVTRRIDDGHLLWTYPGFTAVLERCRPPENVSPGRRRERATEEGMDDGASGAHT